MVPAVVQQAVVDPLWFRGRPASVRAQAMPSAWAMLSAKE